MVGGSGAVDYDDLLLIGPIVGQVRQQALGSAGGSQFVAVTDVPGTGERVATSSAQGRTTVVVLVAQLLVLLAVVLWMVLVGATDDRRAELALARLRGRGRRGAAAYLLSELLPLTLAGVAVGVLVSPFVMALVAKVVFPVPVPLEVPGGSCWPPWRRAWPCWPWCSRRPGGPCVSRWTRCFARFPARHAARGAGVAEVAMIVFSLTAVVALVTGRLEGPLATLAPTLLAVAGGLLLGRALGPVTRFVSRRLLRSGRAVAAAGIVNAVRRPAARRVLAMVVVATALLVFCVTRWSPASTTGRTPPSSSTAPGTRSRSNPTSRSPTSWPRCRRPIRTISTSPRRDHGEQRVADGAHRGRGPDSVPAGGLLPAVAARSRRLGRDPRAGVDPVLLTGETLDGTVASNDLRLTGQSKKRVERPGSASRC